MSGKDGFQDHGGGGRAWLPVWLVSAATVAGLVYVLSAEREVVSPVSPEEIAERTARVGRLSLAQPVSAAKAAAPASASTPTRSAPEPGTGGESAPVKPVPAAATATSDDTVSGETRGSQAAVPEEQAPATPGDRAPAAPADQPESIDTQQAAPDALADAGKPPVAAEGLPTRHTGKPVPMRLVPRPHLPGQPYQLVPVPADGRPE